jgi:YHS domain-containing protein
MSLARVLFRSKSPLAALLGVVLSLLIGFVTLPVAAKEALVFTGIVKGVAVGGYDPVAYFTDAKPVVGKTELTASHEGATWRFASEANRTAFLANPGKYAPQYGGYCAWAVSQGYTAKGDPKAWTIAGGKLYLNYDKGVQANWEKDIPGNVKKAEVNWPKLVGTSSR